MAFSILLNVDMVVTASVVILNAIVTSVAAPFLFSGYFFEQKIF
jgi:hypothetical protein